MKQLNEERERTEFYLSLVVNSKPLCIYTANLRNVFTYSDFNKSITVIIVGYFQYYLSISNCLRS